MKLHFRGKSDQADFLNQVLLVETILSPKQLLYSILDIEMSLDEKDQLETHHEQSTLTYYYMIQK